jgi:hypothetical protein
MKNNTYKLYIGSNNATGQVDLDLIELTLNKYFQGYTIESADGYWNGTREKTVLITLTSDLNQLQQVISELKEVLQQEAIAYQKISDLHFI